MDTTTESAAGAEDIADCATAATEVGPEGCTDETTQMSTESPDGASVQSTPTLQSTPAVEAGAQKRRRRFGALTDRLTAKLVVWILAAAVVGLAVALGIVSTSLSDRNEQIAAQQAQTADNAKAEQVALSYAKTAATMDYKSLDEWRRNLVAGTSPELTSKLSDAATSMEQVIVPLQWTSTAEPIAAQVTSQNGSVYVVRAFVAVSTKNAQAPEGVQSTATYTVTLDKSKNWLITDVGGVVPAGPR
ncbi:hypothetical protein [Gordonia polyisoprenivorans]|uniref:hypothetical protein n=1 Tax=Gordonia polyisoprenivorans TaxID=84595 RepID=UPI001AD78059|nr:hypothetical protein [Gordonia polyisoprenivorans]QTI68983.1 hypothetical protein J6U32_26640 [Gordonia polyisoprenivorans]